MSAEEWRAWAESEVDDGLNPEEYPDEDDFWYP
jgi:hypothetical protein